MTENVHANCSKWIHEFSHVNAPRVVMQINFKLLRAFRCNNNKTSRIPLAHLVTNISWKSSKWPLHYAQSPCYVLRWIGYRGGTSQHLIDHHSLESTSMFICDGSKTIYIVTVQNTCEITKSNSWRANSGSCGLAGVGPMPPWRIKSRRLVTADRAQPARRPRIAISVKVWKHHFLRKWCQRHIARCNWTFVTRTVLISQML